MELRVIESAFEVVVVGWLVKHSGRPFELPGPQCLPLGRLGGLKWSWQGKYDVGHSKCRKVLQRPTSRPRHRSTHASGTPLLGCPTRRRKLLGPHQGLASSCGSPVAWLAPSTGSWSSLLSSALALDFSHYSSL